MPFFPPGEKLRQRNLRAGTYQHSLWVSREVSGLGEKKSVSPHLRDFPMLCKALAGGGMGYSIGLAVRNT